MSDWLPGVGRGHALHRDVSRGGLLRLRAEWSQNHIANQVEVREAIDAYNESVIFANAYLRSWIGLALHDAVQWSDIVAALAYRKRPVSAVGRCRSSANYQESLLDQKERIEESH